MKALALIVALMLAAPIHAATESPQTEEQKHEAQKKREEAEKKAKEAEKQAEEAKRKAKEAKDEADEAKKDENEYPEKVTLELDDVDDSAVNALVEKIDDIKKAGKTKELWIRIHSYGGSVDAGNKLIDAIENAGMPTVCVADHQAMSMGFYVLQSCDKRLMTKRTLLLIHEPSGGARGNASQMAMIADYLAKMNLAMLEMAARRMNMSVEEIRAKAGSTAWTMGWQEALDHKAVDGVIYSKDIPPTLKVEKKLDLFMLLFGGKVEKNEKDIRSTTDSR